MTLLLHPIRVGSSVPHLVRWHSIVSTTFEEMLNGDRGPRMSVLRRDIMELSNQTKNIIKS